jgi:hypothetical protein
MEDLRLMAKIMIKAGAVIDVPTRDEVREDISAAVRDMAEIESERLRARARAFTPMRISGNIGNRSTFLLDATPESGYVWNLKLISVQLVGSGTCVAYISSSAPQTGATPQRLIGTGTVANSANQIMTWSSSQVLLFPDESIYLTATSNLLTYFITAMQVPAEMIFKAYD